MPYTNQRGRLEKGRSLGHVPLADSPIIQQKLQGYRVVEINTEIPIESGLLVAAEEIPGTVKPPSWVMAFDGSPQEVATRDLYPSTRVGYVQIAGILVNLEQMISQEILPFVDPSIIRSCTQEALHSIVLPSSNVCRPDCDTVRDSWRFEIYDIFRDYTVEEIPLLDTLMMILQRSDKFGDLGGVVLARCSTTDCIARNIEISRGGSDCPSCRHRLFPTDVLRIHEEVSEFNSNLTALGRLMSVLEHVTFLAYLDYLSQRQPHLMGRVAFVMDGPLATFGPQAWLHTPILRFIVELTEKLIGRNMSPPVIVGIEKTGQFAEHASAIQEKLKPRTLMRLSDDYIYERILVSRDRPDTSYGRDEYYGRKFFYRTAQRRILTITIPPLVDPSSTEANDLKNFPTLAATLNLLDQVGTSLYENAVIPIALAHSYAAIPLRTGSKVLTLLTKQFVDSLKG